jgi:hypothetical protein
MRRRRLWQAPAGAALVLGMLLVTGGAPATASDDPLGDLTGTVTKQVEPLTHAVTPQAPQAPQAPRAPKASPAPRSTPQAAGTPSSDPTGPSSAGTTGGNDVEDPRAPDHGAADVLESDLAGQPVLGAGSTRSTVRDDDSTSADSTLLAVGGMEVAGSHADSRGQQQDVFEPTADGTDALCDGSGGQACFDVLYAGSAATDDGHTSESSSSGGLGGACLGGDGASTSTSACDAPVSAGVAKSESHATRDQRTGRTRAASRSSLVDVCLTAPAGAGLPLPGLPDLPLPELPGLPLPGSDALGCTVGLALLQSEGAADSGGSTPSASRDSSVGSLTLAGTTQDLDQTQAGELPPGCPAGSSALCAYLDQGETYLGPGSLAGSAQEAVKAQVLPGILGSDLLTLIGARSETLVHDDGGEAVTATPSHPVVSGHEGSTVRHGTARAAVALAPGAAGGLPNTGGPSSGLLALGLLGLGLGSMLLAVSRSSRLLARAA